MFLLTKPMKRSETSSDNIIITLRISWILSLTSHKIPYTNQLTQQASTIGDSVQILEAGVLSKDYALISDSNFQERAEMPIVMELLKCELESEN